mmetsp:Transcript_20418/g.64087  ORF Transcript_20418/g.64087 Transcript_20418/m.64087 type:complete len:196 (-) Transcript_20418:506-1093(-)
MANTNKLVQESWTKVEALGLETVGILFFKRIFDIAPGAIKMFSFRDEPNVYESPRFKKHAVGVVTTVGTAVAGLEDLAALVPVLQDLGSKHVTYGVESQHYDIVGHALLDTLALGLGAAFTPEVKAAWEAVFALVATTMKGDHYAVSASFHGSADDWFLAPDPGMRCTPPSSLARIEAEAKSKAAADDWYTSPSK